MSLGYLGRLCARAVQAAVRAEQKQPGTKQSAAHHPPPARWFSSGGRLAARSAEKKVKTLRRAEKDEKLMNLVCWGPN